MNGLRSYSCSLCSIICNSSEQLRCHQSSRAHLKKCMNAKIDLASASIDCYQPWQMSPRSDSSDLMTCPSCFEQLTSNEMLTHSCEGSFTFDGSCPSPLASLALTPSPQPSPKKSPSVGRLDFYCLTCEVALHSQANYDIHVKGKKHLDKQKQKLVLHAQVNDYNGSDLESLSCSLDAVSVVEGNDCPYKGASFSKTPTNLLKHNLPNSSSSSFSTPPSLYCDICQSPLNSSSQLLSHLNGRKHRNRLALHTGLTSPIVKLDCSSPSSSESALLPSSPKIVNQISHYAAPLKSMVCSVCGVSVGITEVDNHERGRAHIFKASMDVLTKICDEYFNEDRPIQRQFSSHLRNFTRQLPPLSESMNLKLITMANSAANTVLKVNFNDITSISTVAMAIALSLIRENRVVGESFSSHFFAVWICPYKSTIPQRMEEVHKLSLNLSENRPRLMNILKDSYSMEDRHLAFTQHEIAFSTPGGLRNLLESHPKVRRAICALVFTDVGVCVDNDPTADLLNFFTSVCCRDPSKCPRIIFITDKEVPKWIAFQSFSVL